MAAWLDAAFRPLNDFYLWCQTVDQLIRGAQDDLTGISEDLDGLTITVADCWQHTIIEVENGDFVVVQKCPFAGIITNSVTDADSGTCLVRPKINGTNVGVSNNSVSTTESDVTHSAANTFAVGDTISYTIASNSNCLGARVQISYTRVLAP